MNAYVALGIAIVLEVVATTSLKLSDGFTKLGFGIGALVAYGVCFYFLSQTLRTVPTGIAYAIWSGVGVVLVSLVGWLFLKQRLDGPAILGIGFILAGVVILNVFSKTVAH